MTLADYSALSEGVELAKQKRLLIQRYFISAILSTQSTKKISPEDVLYLSLFDKTEKEKTDDLVNRLFAKELKRRERNG
jgi:hypothetical protein